jgi:hypothetical protein
MKIYEGNKWLFPFSSRLSCSNTINGECDRGLTLEECMKKCENNENCQIGYFVDINREPKSNYKSYCALLNSHYFSNLNMLDNLVSNTNPTKLSTDRDDINYTLFYNEKRFPNRKNFPLDFEKYIFSGDFIYLKHNTNKYLNINFKYIDNKSENVNIKIILNDKTFPDLRTRITKYSCICFLNENMINFISNINTKLKWTNSQSNSIFFIFKNCNVNLFINENDLFSLYNPILKLYLYINNDNELILDNDKFTLFSFEKNPIQVPNKQNDNYNADFLCKYYKDCTNEYVPKINYIFISIIIFIIFIISIWIIILYRIIRK